MEKCIRCTEPKKNCNAVGLLALPAAELVPLCKKRKQFLGMTAQALADKSKVPIGTVNRFFSGDLADFRYDTAHNIVCALWEGSASECCEDAKAGDDSEVKMLREIVRHQAATIEHNERQIQRLRDQIDRKDEYIDRLAKKAGI